MSKQKKSKTKAKARKPQRAGGRKGIFAPVAGVILIVAAGVGYFFWGKQPTPANLQAATAANCPTEGIPRLERRPTLPANLFVGRVRSAYAAAAAIPEVLDQLYCYCHCRENMGHKSLLSCYADNHAAGCDICIVEAEMAAQMTAGGSCAAEIQQAIDKRFGQI